MVLTILPNLRIITNGNGQLSEICVQNLLTDSRINTLLAVGGTNLL